jgi:L-malate glycosyltransferase
MAGAKVMNHVQTLHQFVVGASLGDAIYNQAVILQKWLQARGWDSNIYAEHIRPEVAHLVYPYTAYQPATPREVVILHYSIGSTLLEHLLNQNLSFILIYHNLTPPHYMAGLNTHHQQLLQKGLDMLPRFAQPTLLALADSAYNQQDLAQAGFTCT